MHHPQLIHTVPDLRATVANWRAAGDRIALVPTMGALHEGHLELVRLAARHAERVIVSIFVNPAQFAPHEDFDRYPRTLEMDSAKLAKEPAHLIYAPDRAAMYPEGFATRVLPEGAAEGLESDARPHFFGGVATVVTKLFLQSSADIAVFGEKDYQQLRVVQQLARDLDIPIRIVPAPISREPDGLARSSRNAYLSHEERSRAPVLFQTLSYLSQGIADGLPIADALKAGRTRLESKGFRVDYLEARDAETLKPAEKLTAPLRLLVAARLGKVRLIDNIVVDVANI